MTFLLLLFTFSFFTGILDPIFLFWGVLNHYVISTVFSISSVTLWPGMHIFDLYIVFYQLHTLSFLYFLPFVPSKFILDIFFQVIFQFTNSIFSEVLSGIIFNLFFAAIILFFYYRIFICFSLFNFHLAAKTLNLLFTSLSVLSLLILKFGPEYFII